MTTELPLRPVGDRVLLKRVIDRGRLIELVAEKHGVDDRVLQVAEVVGVGTAWKEGGRYEALDLKAGDLIVYNQARVYDHFRWEHEDILVYPGYWVLGIVKDGVLVEHPELRRYEKQPI